MDAGIIAECTSTSLKLKIPLSRIRVVPDHKSGELSKIAEHIIKRRPHVTPCDRSPKTVHHQEEISKKIICNKYFLQCIKPRSMRRYRRMKCVACDHSYIAVYKIKEHLINHLVNDMIKTLQNTTCGRILCVVCMFAIHDIQEYDIHLREHANLPVHRCTVCKEIYKSAKQYKIHIETHV